MTVKLKALRSVSYGGTRHFADDVFSASPKHAKVLVAAKAAEHYREPPKKEKKEKEKEVAKTSPQKPQKTTEEQDTTARVSEKKTQLGVLQSGGEYGRRDMVSEGSRK